MNGPDGANAVVTGAPIVRWLCGECGETHDDEDLAVDCFESHHYPPDVHPLYVCPTCDQDYDTEDLARECMAEHIERESATPPTSAELEAAGQQRLLP